VVMVQRSGSHGLASLAATLLMAWGAASAGCAASAANAEIRVVLGPHLCGLGTRWVPARNQCVVANTEVACAVSTAARAATPGAQMDSDRIPVADAPALGPATALVTVVAFSDFQCPFCARVEPTLAQLRERYGRDLRVVWRNNPLPFHPNAMPAAEAALEARAQRGDEAFWQMHDLVFANQRALERADLERYAAQVGLDLARFRSALDQHAHRATIERDMGLALRLNAEGVPNFFINGTNVVGAQPLERFTAVIDQVLARARTIAPADQVYARMVADPIPSPDAAPAAPSAPSAPTPQADPAAVYRVPVDGAPARGPADALVTLVVFSDFECPFCARVEPTLAQLRARYGRELRVVFRHHPLSFHPNAELAAEAAAEAFAQRGAAGFWRMHDLVFANQRALGRADLERYAAQVGLDLARFRSALDQQSHQRRIAEDGRLAESLGAGGTPAFFINGRLTMGAQPPDEFARLIDEVLAQARARVAAGVPRGQVYAQLIARGATAPVYLGTTAPTAPTVAPLAPAAAPPTAAAQIRASHILIAYTGATRAASTVTRSRDDARRLAELIVVRVRGGASFDSIARQYSDEPNAAQNGGDLGLFRRGTMVEAFERAAFGLRVGETSGLVETPFGFHVIRRTQ
jgi:protein-disulfide isomerase